MLGHKLLFSYVYIFVYVNSIASIIHRGKSKSGKNLPVLLCLLLYFEVTVGFEQTGQKQVSVTKLYFCSVNILAGSC